MQCMLIFRGFWFKMFQKLLCDAHSLKERSIFCITIKKQKQKQEQIMINLIQVWKHIKTKVTTERWPFKQILYLSPCCSSARAFLTLFHTIKTRSVCQAQSVWKNPHIRYDVHSRVFRPFAFVWKGCIWFLILSDLLV